MWKITGSFKGTRWVSNTTLNQNSSEFTQPYISVFTNTDIVNQPTCGKNNGSITLDTSKNSIKNVLTVQWFDSNNQKVGEGFVANNLGPGNYYAKVFNGNCSATSPVFPLYNVQPQIIDQNLVVTNPSCGLGGSITGLIPTTNSQDGAMYAWTDQNGVVVGNSTSVNNLVQGVYTFTLTDTVSKCSINYGPITLINTTGPHINQTQAIIQPTNCGQSTGSISHILATGSGTLNYAWLNSQQQTVSTDSVLLNQPAGVYTLKVTDTSQCGPVYTSALTIPQTNGITLDTSNVKITIASCSNNNGSITGINTTGATLYQWVNANNTIVGTAANLQNAAPGNYTFTASNSFGCSVTSKTYAIGQQAATVFPPYNNSINFACAGTNSGSVTVYIDSLVKGERWADSLGNTIGGRPMLSNVPSGTYQLYLTDKNGCESFYMRYSVLTIQKITIAPGSEQITNDQCGLKQGSITGIQITGGILPYAYTWTDANNNTVSSTLNLAGVGGGTFILAVTDMSGCGIVTAAYTVKEQNNDISPPLVNNLQVCGPGNAVLKVNNPSAQYNYRLYSTETGGAPVDEKASGIFNVVAKTNSVFYVSQFYGDCESARTEVQVNVGLTSADIANTFTPNGDGINDLWNINGIGSYPNAIVQVFTRYGQKVFESKGYSNPFDGTFNGKKLPAGVYYYIINLQSNCTLISGSLTIIR